MAKLMKTIKDMFQLSQPKKKVFLLSEGSENDENLLSNKGSRLCSLKRLNIDTPSAFILSTDVYQEFLNSFNNEISNDVIAEIQKSINHCEKEMDKEFGASSGEFAPLLLSVRVGVGCQNSGANICAPVYESSTNESMTDSGLITLLGTPDSWNISGLQETILGIGINDAICAHLARFTNERYSKTVYCKFLVSYGITICKIPYSTYDNILYKVMSSANISNVALLQEKELEQLVACFKAVYTPPIDPFAQLMCVISEAYKLWIENAEKRNLLMDISKDAPIALIVQAVCYGMPGILFTRNPVTGLKSGLIGDVLLENGMKTSLENYRNVDSKMCEQLEYISKVLEVNFSDMQDIDFVIDDRTKALYILQSRPASRTSAASLRVAVDFCHERILNEREALLQIRTSKLTDCSLKPFFSTSDLAFASGCVSAPGVVQGRLFFTKEQCMSEFIDDESIIFCCSDFEQVDDHILKAVKGIVCINSSVLHDTARACRTQGKPLVELVGCSIEMSITSVHHYHNKFNRPSYNLDHRVHCLNNVSGSQIREGALVTLDGSNGRLYLGSIYDTFSDCYHPELKMISAWADCYKSLNIFCSATQTNAMEMKKMIENQDVDGWGHISTDTSFCLNDERLSLTQTLVSSKSLLERAEASSTLLDIFRQEWRDIYRIAKGRPLVMYLLSSHLGKFFPDSEHFGEAAVKLNKDVTTLKENACNLFAVNPSFALQGSRISLCYPFITELQVRAMIEAAVDIRKEDPNNLVHVNICITNCSSTEEIKLVTKNIVQIGSEILAENEMLGAPVLSVGISIDTVKMALIVKDWVQHVAFITFNTTKLTELCLGVSMQDRHLFYGNYLLNDVMPNDPFKTIDHDVFKIIQRSCLIARKHCPNLTIGIDGCHTHDERSIKLFSMLPIQYLNVNQRYCESTKIACAQSRIQSRENNTRDHHHFMDEQTKDNFFHFNLSG